MGGEVNDRHLNNRIDFKIYQTRLAVGPGHNVPVIGPALWRGWDSNPQPMAYEFSVLNGQWIRSPLV